jgi:hypothetical protein
MSHTILTSRFRTLTNHTSIRAPKIIASPISKDESRAFIQRPPSGSLCSRNSVVHAGSKIPGRERDRRDLDRDFLSAPGQETLRQ